ncbi:hypothetical protein PROFUN_16574 [Planoprotostelium fungivorum]|uniref:F-box domain-containing protein n=1 Tax=Planoprotostelium fungivorum TaxID=1890364 RepID=A0A2P6MQE6_9EUKA|nr:hypothetical protein PROFUN_16574 [Planoprotostelium fungivorum]
MAPAVGQGTSQALEDAALLVRSLCLISETRSLEDVLDVWEGKRKERVRFDFIVAGWMSPALPALLYRPILVILLILCVNANSSPEKARRQERNDQEKFLTETDKELLTESRDFEDFNIWEAASRDGHVGLIQVRTDSGTAIGLICRSGSLRHRAKQTDREQAGSSIELAWENEHLDVLKLLLKVHPDEIAEDVHYRANVRHQLLKIVQSDTFAHPKDYAEILEILLKLGADVEFKSGEIYMDSKMYPRGLRPIELAKMRGANDIIEDRSIPQDAETERKSLEEESLFLKPHENRMTTQREESVSFDDDTIALIASWFSLDDIRSTLSQVNRQWRRVTTRSNTWEWMLFDYAGDTTDYKLGQIKKENGGLYFHLCSLLYFRDYFHDREQLEDIPHHYDPQMWSEQLELVRGLRSFEWLMRVKPIDFNQDGVRHNVVDMTWSVHHRGDTGIFTTLAATPTSSQMKLVFSSALSHEKHEFNAVQWQITVNLEEGTVDIIKTDDSQPSIYAPMVQDALTMGLEREDAPDQGPLFRTLNNHWMKYKISEAIFKGSDPHLRDRIHLTHMQPSPCRKLLRIVRRDGQSGDYRSERTPLRLFGMNTRGIEEIDERLISELEGKHLKPSQVRWILTEIVLLEEPIHNYRNYLDQQRRVLSLLRILDQHMNITDVKYSFSWPHSES